MKRCMYQSITIQAILIDRSKYKIAYIHPPPLLKISKKLIYVEQSSLAYSLLIIFMSNCVQ